MIIIDAVAGNIAGELKSMYEANKNAVEKLRISRLESERARMRKTTDRGTDVALALPAGTRLRHGDLLQAQGRMIVVEIEPERVAVVRVKGSGVRLPALVGHAIGNLHRPIKVEGDRIYFPIQSDGELEMLKKQFAPVIDHVEIGKDVIVFEPEEGMRAHEH